MTQAVPAPRPPKPLASEFDYFYRQVDNMQRLMIQAIDDDPSFRELHARRAADLAMLRQAVMRVDPARPTGRVNQSPVIRTRVPSFYDRDLDMLETINAAPSAIRSFFGRSATGRKATRAFDRINDARQRLQHRIGAIPKGIETEVTSADRMLAGMTQAALDLTERVWTADKPIKQTATPAASGARRRGRTPSHAQATPMDQDIQTFLEHAEQTRLIIEEWKMRAPLPAPPGLESLLDRRLADVQNLVNNVARIHPGVPTVSPVRIGDGKTRPLFDSPTLAAISTPNPDLPITHDRIVEHMTDISAAKFGLMDALKFHGARAKSGPWHVGAPDGGIKVLCGPDTVNELVTRLGLEALEVAERGSMEAFAGSEQLGRAAVAGRELEDRVDQRVAELPTRPMPSVELVL